MTINSEQRREGLPRTVADLPAHLSHAGQYVPGVPLRDSRGSPEGNYLDGPGKPTNRQIQVLKDQKAEATVKVAESWNAVERAEATDRERRDNHRGGDRPWPLRWFIPAAVVAEAVTAYVAMEALVDSQSLAVGLSLLAALIGAGIACVLANRRLNRLSVPAAARTIEGIFVAVLTILRYDSLHVQGTGFLTAAGAAALAALISALALIGIEEIVVETRTFAMFLGTLRMSWARWRFTAAEKRLRRIQARLQAAVSKLQQHFLDFLLRTEGLSLDQATQRASALKAARTDTET